MLLCRLSGRLDFREAGFNQGTSLAVCIGSTLGFAVPAVVPVREMQAFEDLRRTVPLAPLFTALPIDEGNSELVKLRAETVVADGHDRNTGTHPLVADQFESIDSLLVGLE